MKLPFALTIAAFTTVANVSAFGCKPDEVKGWMASCDSLVNISQIRCDNRACHTALHRLVEQETLDCYASSGLGPASDLVKYKTLDGFCHGEGPDPTELSTASPPTNATGSGSFTGNASIATNDTSVSVPATTPTVVPSPPLPSSAASSNSVIAITLTAAITLSIMMVV